MIEGHEIIGITEDSYITDAIFFMARNKIRRIAVYRNREIIGLFTIEEALYHILYNETENRLKEAKLKPVIKSRDSLAEIIKDMIYNKIDAVFIEKDGNTRIVTYRDVIREINWANAGDRVSKISRVALVVSPYARIRTAASIMVNNGVRHVPVYEGDLYGIISARDIVYRYPELDLNCDVNKVMIPEVYSVSSETPIGTVAQDIIRLNIGSAIVNKNQIVTLKDLIEYALRNLIKE
ncbi:CBS domain-containing protein [Stygiolobus caldivivus]|uniref:CBS domain-containing protein n=1 Tax=Stygiolobus caldivivus TaxID=2824673 RepID=A0A8D5U4Z2_9CREN|nr:CBS domain-containing protein [Stygiolobus caldivivus]BCU69170.1 CBS domain-containing protein [Stygiolobus caldivivus]